MTKYNKPDSFTRRLSHNASRINSALDALLDNQSLAGEIMRPTHLMNAIRHGVLNGGKRIRPFLLIETAAMFGATGKGVLQTACALECLHCYSLIHDDLPSMDDDDLRRGQPTVHKAFDEAMAVLAGDALLTFAFDLIADPIVSNDANIRASLVQMLARSAGHGGMIGGQVLDIAAETSILNEEQILQLQSMKTGALIRFACEAGATIADAPKENIQSLTRFGELIGRAFQLADDLLDVTSNSTAMGKATGKDEAKGKKTLIDYYGIEGSRTRLQEMLREANALLSSFGTKAEILRQTAQFIVERKH